jgi:hypothetical protein
VDSVASSIDGIDCYERLILTPLVHWFLQFNSKGNVPNSASVSSASVGKRGPTPVFLLSTVSDSLVWKPLRVDQRGQPTKIQQ